MHYFPPANIAAMTKQLRAMAAARQVTMTVKRGDPTLGGWVTLNAQFGNGLEYVLILDTEWGFLEKFPRGLTPAQRLQRSTSKAAFEPSTWWSTSQPFTTLLA
jgi:hypothetical protein